MKTVSDPGGEIEFVATEDSITASLSHLREAPIWRGSVDVYSAGMIEGWIAKANNFLASVEIDIVMFGEVIGTTASHISRPDIAQIISFPATFGYKFNISTVADDVAAALRSRLKARMGKSVTVGDALEVRVSGTKLNLPMSPALRATLIDVESLAQDLARNALGTFQNEFISLRDQYLNATTFSDGQVSDVKVLANYLPQFHPFAENNDWWGEGFTEWTNVVVAKPLMKGHYQPRLPADLGFYDLRLDAAHEAQIDMAKTYGLSGFIYYFYWFSGKLLMNMPVDRHLDKNYDLNFCLCWANESWSRRWDGSESTVLMAQRHTEADDDLFIQSCLKYFKSERYIKINGAPLLQVYRISLLANPKATIARWRKVVKEAGFPDLHVTICETFGLENPQEFGCDSSSQFPPHGISAVERNAGLSDLIPGFTGKIYDYAEVVQNEISRPRTPHVQFRAAMPSWDNTSRRGLAGNFFHGATPELFQTWLSHLVRHARANLPESHRFVLINAWNEWAEGAHLEPDRLNGRKNLDAVRNALAPESNALAPLQGPLDGSNDDEMAGTRRYVEGLLNSNLQMSKIFEASYSATRPPKGGFISLPSDLYELRNAPSDWAVYLDDLQGMALESIKIATADREGALSCGGWIKTGRQSMDRSLPVFVTLSAPGSGLSGNRFGGIVSDRVNRIDVVQLLSLDKEESWCGFRIDLNLSKVLPGVYDLEFIVADASSLSRGYIVASEVRVVIG